MARLDSPINLPKNCVNIYSPYVEPSDVMLTSAVVLCGGLLIHSDPFARTDFISFVITTFPVSLEALIIQ